MSYYKTKGGDNVTQSMKERMKVAFRKYRYGTDDYLADGLVKEGFILLPCKIHQNVFVIRRKTKNILNCIVIGYDISADTHKVKLLITEQDRTTKINFEDFGQIAFLFLDDAENALNKL